MSRWGEAVEELFEFVVLRGWFLFFFAGMAAVANGRPARGAFWVAVAIFCIRLASTHEESK